MRLRSQLARLSIAVLILLVTTGFGDRLRWGFVNRLPYPITIIRHAGRDEIRTVLKPLDYLPAGTGRNLPFDLARADGVVFARYKPSELPVFGKGPIRYVVISIDGVRVESRDAALQGIPHER